MIPATKLAVLVLVCCLLAGCAVKRPVVQQSVQVFDSMGGKELATYTVHCPSDPLDDGLWLDRKPTEKETKVYCSFWHKFNHKTLAQRWRSSEQSYARYMRNLCEKSHPAEECDPLWKPCGKDERCQP